METVLKVRRWVLFEGLSQREVSRRTVIARQMIRKYLEDDRPAEYRRNKASGSRRLFDYEVILRELYEADLGRPVRERRTIRGFYDALVCAGYAGSYTMVCRYVKRLKPSAGKSVTGYIPLEFAPGDALQFDWSQEVVLLGGVDTKIYVAHFRLCHAASPFWPLIFGNLRRWFWMHSAGLWSFTAAFPAGRSSTMRRPW